MRNFSGDQTLEQSNRMMVAAEIDTKQAWKSKDLYVGKDEEAYVRTISSL